MFGGTLGSVTNATSSNLRCTSCDYDLRGLDISSVCPECNFPITESIAATQAASRISLKRHTLGTRMVIPCLSVLLVWAIIQHSIPQTTRFQYVVLYRGLTWVLFVAHIIGATGWLLLLTQVGSIPQTKRSSAIRITSLIIIILYIVYVTAGRVGIGLPYPLGIVFSFYIAFLLPSTYPIVTIVYGGWLHASICKSASHALSKIIVWLAIAIGCIHAFLLVLFLTPPPFTPLLLLATLDDVTEFVLNTAPIVLLVLQLLIAIAIARALSQWRRRGAIPSQEPPAHTQPTSLKAYRPGSQ